MMERFIGRVRNWSEDVVVRCMIRADALNTYQSQRVYCVAKLVLAVHFTYGL